MLPTGFLLFLMLLGLQPVTSYTKCPMVEYPCVIKIPIIGFGKYRPNRTTEIKIVGHKLKKTTCKRLNCDKPEDFCLAC